MICHVTNTPLTKRPYRGADTTSFRTYQVFLDADCRFMLPGLLALCEKNGIDVTEKEIGNLIVFVNTKKTLIKIIACNGTIDPVLGVYRMPPAFASGHFSLDIIAQIPRAFGYSGHFDISEAMAKALEKKMKVH